MDRQIPVALVHPKKRSGSKPPGSFLLSSRRSTTPRVVTMSHGLANARIGPSNLPQRQAIERMLFEIPAWVRQKS